INYREGALVTANNTVLTTVSDVKEVYAYFSMNEKEYLDFLDNTQGKTTAEKLKNLPEASLVLANGQEYAEKGKIQAVTGQIDPTTGSIQFRATFPNPNKLLTNGNSGTIKIPQHFSNSLVIPEVATFEQQGKVFVYKVENDTLKQAIITLKSRADNYAVVESGLKNGDVILAQGLNKVRTGTVIKPQPISMDSLVKKIQPIF
ncbi:MAG: efflux RND transporter periplasmic adaptor subunit, partial [Capnocytophaga ochracea]